VRGGHFTACAVVVVADVLPALHERVGAVHVSQGVGRLCRHGRHSHPVQVLPIPQVSARRNVPSRLETRCFYRLMIFRNLGCLDMGTFKMPNC